MFRTFGNCCFLSILITLQLSCSDKEHKSIADRWQNDNGNILVIDETIAGDYKINVELNSYESAIIKLSNSCTGEITLSKNDLVCDGSESSMRVILSFKPEQNLLQLQVGNESSFENFYRVAESSM